MKIWRIAILSGGIVAVGIFLLFSYQIFIIENAKMIEGMNEQFGSVLLPVIGFPLYVFFFIVTLVSFPAFWFKSLPWFFNLTHILMGNKSGLEGLDKNDIFGLLISSSFLLLLVFIGVHVQSNYI